MTATRTPTEGDMIKALIILRAQNPTLGIAKLHALLLAEHPDWTVSEKRTKKILQHEGLVLGSDQGRNKANDVACSGDDSPFPISKLVTGLDISKWTNKVEVRYFGRNKGKGLVAKDRIAEGDILWKEDPFVLAPEWDVFDLQVSSAACAHCSTPLMGSSLVVSCSASSPCTARFCSRLCLARSATTHPLLCPAQNPASVPLVAFARKNEWMALHALSRCTARVLLQEQQGDDAFQAEWEFVQSLAQLSMEERAKGGWLRNAEPDRETWKKAYELYMQAFRTPVKETEKKRLARILRKPVRKELTEWLFEYDAFLRGLGRMSLNLEAHGGLYVLHSHINHACDPNISVRHLEQRAALARISVIARRDIGVGEELTITYVNPQMDLERRRQNLLEWGFGTCRCARCVKEQNVVASKPIETGSDTGGNHDLERELKAGLGVM